MAQYTTSTTPTITASSTTINQLVLYNTTVGAIAEITSFSWGGSDTSLIAQTTRWARVTNTPATPTALNVESTNTAAGPAPICLAATFGTAATNATTNKQLFLQAWNSQGGAGVVTLPLMGTWKIAGGSLGTAGSAIGIGNTVGSGSNCTFGLQWAE